MRFESQEHWQAKRLAYVPGAWVARVENRHARQVASDLRAGNLWLLDLSEGMRRLRVPVTMTDGELIEFAGKRAAEALGLGEVSPGVFLSEPAALRARLAAYVKRYGIAEPEPIRITRKGRRAGVSDAGAIARMCCPLWWRRKLRQGQARAIEAKAIELGYVHKRAEIYASDATVARRQQQRARNAAGLEATEAINRDTGEIFNLARLAGVSVANPRIRRGELMTRIAGFEAIARGLGHAGEFITLTAPSKYHAKRTAGPGQVEDNPKYSGATPRETQGYLARLWAKIRAKLARVGIAPYGFRIAEPHHDATPHWHMLLFVVADAVQVMRNVIRSYALKEDGDEAGAADARVTFKAIDWTRGSAAGYVAKYVSKNIDGGGYQVQGDTEGGPGDVFPGHRVEAWASTWGIRQFQQVGGPPVGVWRELRRLEKGLEYPVEVEAARSAADCGRSGHDETGAAGNWRRYVEVMGGPVMRRDDRPITVARSRDGERYVYTLQAPEPANATRYGETAPGVVFGLLHRPSGAVFASVRYRWEIKGGRDYVLDRENGAAGGGHASMGCRRGGKAAASESVGKCAEPSKAAKGFDAVFWGSGSWSPVNNCTRAIPPALSWAVLRELTPVADRAIWLEGAALSAWVASKGGEGGQGDGVAFGRATAGGCGESNGVGNAPELRHGAGSGGAVGGAGPGAGQGSGIGTGGAGRVAGA